VVPGAGDKVCVGYDTRWQGLHLTLDPNSGSDVNYFYHVPTDSWWPMSLPITPHVYALMPALQTSARSSVVVLGSAGSVRQYDNGQAQGGSNESFDSYVVIGPLKVGDINNEGVLLGLTAALAKDSANVSAKVYGGVTVEQAYQKVVADSPDYTLTNWSYASTRYWNYWQHPRLDCHAYYLKIADVSNTRWMLEGLVDETAMRGVMRRVR
jgi:hypothetical protein